MASTARVLTPSEVSDLLRIPIGTLYNWRHRGLGPKASKCGKHIRYVESDVMAWLEQQSESPKAS